MITSETKHTGDISDAPRHRLGGNRRQDTIWITERAEGTVSIEHHNGSTIINYGNGGEITLDDVMLTQGQIDLQYF